MWFRAVCVWEFFDGKNSKWMSIICLRTYECPECPYDMLMTYRSKTLDILQAFVGSQWSCELDMLRMQAIACADVYSLR